MLWHDSFLAYLSILSVQGSNFAFYNVTYTETVGAAAFARRLSTTALALILIVPSHAIACDGTIKIIRIIVTADALAKKPHQGKHIFMVFECMALRTVSCAQKHEDFIDSDV